MRAAWWLAGLTFALLAGPALAYNTTSNGTSADGSDKRQTGTVGSAVAACALSGDLVYLTVTGKAVVGVDVSGTWAATLLVQGTIDGTAWTSLKWWSTGTGAETSASSVTSNGLYRVETAGFRTICVRATPYTSGTATVTLNATDDGALMIPRDASGNIPVAFASGSDVEVTKLGTAATVNTAQTGKTADTTIIAAVASTRLLSYGCAETAAVAAAATVILRHGVVAGTCTGNVIDEIELAPNESRNETSACGARGCAIASGACMDVTAGTVDCWTSSLVEAAP